MTKAPITEGRAAGDWYVRDHIGGLPRSIWLVTPETATNMGVHNPERGAGTYFRADPGESIWDCINRKTGWLGPEVTEGRFHRMVLGSAQFYPRIARPDVCGRQYPLWSPDAKTEKAYVASARSQLNLLNRKLEQVCQTVEPVGRNMEVFGHEIRNLLILAATEAEMHCRGILKANHSKAKDLNTKAYARLIEPLQLREYAVSFHDFPDLPSIQPFSGWDKDIPTKSLGWFDAYNGVKHNREQEFARGTLTHAFEAVSACIALLVAQFGQTALSTELSTFVTVAVPHWPIEQMYIPQITEDPAMAVPHPEL